MFFSTLTNGTGLRGHHPSPASRICPTGVPHQSRHPWGLNLPCVPLRLHSLHSPQLPLVFPCPRTSPKAMSSGVFPGSLLVRTPCLHAEATSSNCHSPVTPQTSAGPSAHGNWSLISSQLLSFCFSPQSINYPSFISISTSLETELKSFLEQSSFVSTHKWNTSSTMSAHSVDPSVHLHSCPLNVVESCSHLAKSEHSKDGSHHLDNRDQGNFMTCTSPKTLEMLEDP